MAKLAGLTVPQLWARCGRLNLLPRYPGPQPRQLRRVGSATHRGDRFPLDEARAAAARLVRAVPGARIGATPAEAPAGVCGGAPAGVRAGVPVAALDGAPGAVLGEAAATTLPPGLTGPGAAWVDAMVATPPLPLPPPPSSSLPSSSSLADYDVVLLLGLGVARAFGVPSPKHFDTVVISLDRGLDCGLGGSSGPLRGLPRAAVLNAAAARDLDQGLEPWDGSLAGWAAAEAAAEASGECKCAAAALAGSATGSATGRARPLRVVRGVVFPHPSGVSHFWNGGEGSARAAAVLRAILQGRVW